MMECLGVLSFSGIANLQRFKSKRRINSKIFAVNQTGLLASKNSPVKIETGSSNMIWSSEVGR